jgi:hypothetical protein
MEFLNPFAQPIRKAGREASLSDEPILSPLSSIPVPGPRGSGSRFINSVDESIVAGNEATQDVVTTEQRVLLEHHFSKSRNPSFEERRILAEATGLSIQSVEVCFACSCMSCFLHHPYVFYIPSFLRLHLFLVLFFLYSCICTTPLSFHYPHSLLAAAAALIVGTDISLLPIIEPKI